MNRFKTAADQLTDEEKQTIESLLKYPQLEKVFDRNEPHNLAETKQKMRVTVTELERVIRSGTKSDAENAARIAEAYRTTIEFLEELELIRKNQS
jgi:intergrase/recombinase